MASSRFRPCESEIFTNVSSVVVQVSLAFSFLVLFYFFYVVQVESWEFKDQIDFIVDDFVTEAKQSGLIPPATDEKDLLVLDGAIEIAKQKTVDDFKAEVQQIKSDNARLRQRYMTICGVVVGLMVAGLLVLHYFFSCSSALGIVKETLVILLFTGLTEFLFLNFVSKRYIAADPNKIKGVLGASIQQWLKENKKI